MPIGDGPDIEQFDRKEEDEQKLYEKVDKWWYGLEGNYKLELVEPYYINKAHSMGADEMWNGLVWEDKLDIYDESKGGIIND